MIHVGCESESKEDDSATVFSSDEDRDDAGGVDADGSVCADGGVFHC